MAGKSQSTTVPQVPQITPVLSLDGLVEGVGKHHARETKGGRFNNNDNNNNNKLS